MSNTKDIPFLPPRQISNLKKPDQPEAKGSTHVQWKDCTRARMIT